MKRLKLAKAKCIGCRLCAQLCSANKEEAVWPERARIFIHTSYEDGRLKYHDHYCNLCGICVKSCPEKAITLDEYLRWTGSMHRMWYLCGEMPEEGDSDQEDLAIMCDTCEKTLFVFKFVRKTPYIRIERRYRYDHERISKQSIEDKSVGWQSVNGAS